MRKAESWRDIPGNKVYEPETSFLHVDYVLLLLITVLSVFGLFVLYSAANQSEAILKAQAFRMGLGVMVMLLCANISPHRYKNIALTLYSFSLLLLITVLVVGHIGKGAQRWLGFGVLRFQPSELVKLSLPLMIAHYLSEKPLPPSLKDCLVVALLTGGPALLIAKQPDLGTAIVILFIGIVVLFLAGLSWRTIVSLGVALIATMPLLWYVMRDYQRERVLTFLNPERDPLGAGYHIIQSKIAIGSGGVLGKGWLQGTQSHLAFLPEHATDFIFAVCGEELGLIGALFLITLYFLISARCLAISAKAPDSFTRLLAGSFGVLFFFCAFVNIGMVSGILPVVGLPLPLVSYGGTSVVVLFAIFGVMMSIHSNKRLLNR